MSTRNLLKIFKEKFFGNAHVTETEVVTTQNCIRNKRYLKNRTPNYYPVPAYVLTSKHQNKHDEDISLIQSVKQLQLVSYIQ